jgi:hypothetical protein
MDVMSLRRGLMMGMAGSRSVYEKKATAEFTVNTDSTSTISVGTISAPAECYTSGKMLYVRIRDKAGKRNGHYLGQDGFIANPFPKNGQTNTLAFGNTITYQYDSEGKFVVSKTAFGVYPSGIQPSGLISISARYNSTYTGTINGTFSVDVYLLDWPDGITPFD